MTKEEAIGRYKSWKTNGITLPYLEEWEQWHCIPETDPELYKWIKEQRIIEGLDTKTNSVGLDYLVRL